MLIGPLIGLLMELLMGLFKKKDDYNHLFQRNDTVLAGFDLPGVPENTLGVVKMVNGFAWRRYRVLFDNGVSLGSLDGHTLVHPKHWQRWCVEREKLTLEIKERIATEVAQQDELLKNFAQGESTTTTADSTSTEAIAAESASTTTESASTESATEPASKDSSRLLSMLPEHLVERSRLAKERLTS